ncbi:MAG: hypothetical protein JWN08_3602 [Frankiales bacterium]|nr:hypothetical protein [Frankiales bacterium]
MTGPGARARAPRGTSGTMVGVSTSWSSPDPRRVVTGTAFGQPYERVEQVPPPWRSDAVAAALTVAITVLAGAPVGLLWGSMVPRAEAVLAGDRYLQADPSSDAYIAGDGYFLAACLVAGVVTGLLAWRLARAHGPAVVCGLAVGGLAAALVMMRVGEAVGRDALVDAVMARQDRIDLGAQLGAVTTIAAWPAAALIVYVLVTWLAGRRSDRSDRADPTDGAGGAGRLSSG